LKILVLWDNFGEAPMEVFLINPKDEKQRKRLMSMQDMFVNGTNVPENHPVNKFSEMLYDPEEPLAKFKLSTWPLVLTEPVTIVHTGFLP